MRNAEVIRQWQILRAIETRRAGVTIHELADMVHVTTRTIRRDLQALCRPTSRRKAIFQWANLPRGRLRRQLQTLPRSTR